MRLTIVLLAIGLTVATAWGQSPGSGAPAAAQGQTAATATPAVKPAAGSATAASVSSAKKSQVTVIPMAAPKETTGKATAKVKAPKPPVAPPAQPVEPNAATATEAKPPAEESKKDEPKAISMVGRRDPFISPVIGHTSMGSGCSSGKRCLAVDQIMLTGIVKTDSGMIAIVVNALNKAYFLHENDPVFNGYVVKITGDSIVFRETIQDDLGKPVTREITKKITTPAV